MARIIFTVLIAYLFVVAVVYMAQRRLQYYPDKNYPGSPSLNNVPKMQEIKVKTEDGLELLAWFAAPEDSNGKVVVIYHGNAGNMGERAYKARKFMSAGYGVYLCEYRGYGGNEGFITEHGLYNDARAALKWLEKEGYDASQFILYGGSLGSGPAVQMAKEFKTPYLILEGGFSSAVDVAKGVYPWLPVGMMMLDRYDNISKIKDIKTSLLMVHGEGDPVVDISYGKKLFDAANHPKEFVTLKTESHVNLFDYGADKVIIEWLDRN